MISVAFKIAVIMLLALLVAAPVFATDKEPSKTVPVKAQPVVTPKVAAPEKQEEPEKAEPEQAEPAAEEYDDFTDDNKNGIDDNFEEADRKRVKVLQSVERSKPTETEQKTEVKTGVKKPAPEEK